MAYSLQKFYAQNTILTNLHSDHLDWHRDINEYYRSKIHLLARTQETIIYPTSVLTLFPELRDFPIQSWVIPETLPLEHQLLQVAE